MKIQYLILDTDTDISQHTPYQGFSVTSYIMVTYRTGLM